MPVPKTVPTVARILGLPALFALFAAVALGALPGNAHAQQEEPACLDGGGFAGSGSLLDRDAQPADATHVMNLRFGDFAGCERIVIDLANADGAAATTVGQVNVAFIRDLGLVRVHLPADFPLTTLADQAVQIQPAGDYISGAYTVISERNDRGPFVDIHMAQSVLARAFVLDSPARIVIDAQPGGGTLVNTAEGPQDNVIVVQPRTDVVQEYPLDISGYARTFEGNVMARLYQDGEMVAETSTTAAAWAESWGQYSLSFDSGPEGTLELFVGTLSAQDGSEQGIHMNVVLGEEGTPGGGATTYLIQPGDTLSGIALEYGVSVDALAGLNDIADPSLIYPGNTLIIPGVGGQNPPTGGDNGGNNGNGGHGATYTVVAGDTLSALAEDFGTTVDALVQANDIANPNLIIVGEELTIPAS